MKHFNAKQKNVLMNIVAVGLYFPIPALLDCGEFLQTGQRNICRYPDALAAAVYVESLSGTDRKPVRYIKEFGNHSNRFHGAGPLPVRTGGIRAGQI